MSGFDSLLIPAVLFFALGVFAHLIKSDLKLFSKITGKPLEGVGLESLVSTSTNYGSSRRNPPPTASTISC